MQEMTAAERQQAARKAEFVVNVLRNQGPDEIPVGVLSGHDNDLITDEIRARFWNAVDETGTPHEVFKQYARAAVKHGLLVIDRGSACCGGGIGYGFLQVPQDFTERVKHFLNLVKQKAEARQQHRGQAQQRAMFA